MAATLVVAGSITAASAGTALADNWKFTGQSKSCWSASFGLMCSVTDHYQRVGNAYCDRGLRVGQDAGAYWEYCYKDVSYTTDH